MERMEGKLVKRTDRLFFTFWCPLPLFTHVSYFPLWSLLGGDRCLFLHNSCNTRRRMASVSPSCLILPIRLAGLLVCVPWYQKTFKQSSQTQHNAPGWNYQLKNEARGLSDISPSHCLRMCAEQKYDYGPTDTSAKSLCHVMRLERERWVRDIEATCKVLSVCSEGLTAHHGSLWSCFNP